MRAISDRCQRLRYHARRSDTALPLLGKPPLLHLKPLIQEDHGLRIILDPIVQHWRQQERGDLAPLSGGVFFDQVRGSIALESEGKQLLLLRFGADELVLQG